MIGPEYYGSNIALVLRIGSCFKHVDHVEVGVVEDVFLYFDANTVQRV